MSESKTPDEKFEDSFPITDGPLTIKKLSPWNLGVSQKLRMSQAQMNIAARAEQAAQIAQRLHPDQPVVTQTYPPVPEK